MSAERDGTVVVERVLDAPREVVWQAFAEPDRFAQWFGPEGIVVARDSLTMDVRTGGGWSARLDTVDGEPRYRARARFTEVVTGELLVAEEDFDMGELGPVRLHCRIELHDAGAGRTLLRVVQGSHGDMAGPARQAWAQSLDRLEALCTESLAGPGGSLGRRIVPNPRGALMSPSAGHRVDIEPASAHVTVVIDGVEVADSTRPLVLHETGLPDRYYLPPDDVRLEHLHPTATQTICPFKGEASYWSFAAGEGEERSDVAWAYQEPLPSASDIKGHLCFDDRAAQIRVD